MRSFPKLVLCLALSCSALTHDAESQTIASFPATVSGQWFISYRNGESNGSPDSQFLIRRGYINIRKKLNDRLSGRITPDISVDREGDGEGDLEMRLKYCYVKYDFDDLGFFTSPGAEFGLVHRPWVDFEQGINRYRLQGLMFLDRYDVLTSADFGVTFAALFGGTLDDTYRREVNGIYPGRYGSFSIGLYNGGGYHAIEQNNNKTVEGRLSVRPLPDILPGFQLSYNGIYGKGNTVESPDWTANAVFLSLEHRRFVVTGMYYDGVGNCKGKAVDEDGDAISQSGMSFFGELKMLSGKMSVIGRYDYFDDRPDSDDFSLKRLIGGVAWHVDSKTKVLVDYDVVTRDEWSDYEEAFTQVTIEFGF